MNNAPLANVAVSIMESVKRSDISSIPAGTMKRLLNSITLIVLQMTLLFVGQEAFAFGFSASGNITLFERLGTTKTNAYTWTFEASVLEDKYSYKVTAENGQVFAFASDGQDNYSLFIDDAGRKKFKMPGYLGYVFSGSYPVWSPTTATVLPWIAFCSGSYFESAQTNGYVDLPAAWLPPWAMIEAHIYKVAYEPIRGSSGLPQKLSYVIDYEKIGRIKNGYYQTFAEPSDGERDKLSLMLAKTNNDCVAQFLVNETTNFQGQIIPAVFQFKRYDGNIAFSMITCQVTSITRIEELIPLPRSQEISDRNEE